MHPNNWRVTLDDREDVFGRMQEGKNIYEHGKRSLW